MTAQDDIESLWEWARRVTTLSQLAYGTLALAEREALPRVQVKNGLINANMQEIIRKEVIERFGETLQRGNHHCQTRKTEATVTSGGQTSLFRRPGLESRELPSWSQCTC